MTPTMHDARAARLTGKTLEPRDTYYNGVLALYGAWLREQAQVRGLGFVDLYSPLNNLTLDQRKKQAQWTMIKDAVHPDVTGQVVMATAVLDDLGAPASIGAITIQEKDGQLVSAAGNGKVSDLQGGDAIRFTYVANALPWVLPPEAAEGYALARAARRHSQEKLTVRHLKPGKYAVKIDNTEIGQWTDVELGLGVALEGNALTPQYQQALKVALLNKERNDSAYRPLRDQWGQLKGRKRDLDKLEQAADPQLETKRAEFAVWKAAMAEKTGALLAKARQYEDQIYSLNQPQAHRYEIGLVK